MINHPLTWEKYLKNSITKQTHLAKTPFGTYSVYMSGLKNNEWFYTVLGDYHAPLPCISLEDGKRLCEKDWKIRLQQL